jgi:hypothetical protein
MSPPASDLGSLFAAYRWSPGSEAVRLPLDTLRRLEAVVALLRFPILGPVAPDEPDVEAAGYQPEVAIP